MGFLFSGWRCWARVLMVRLQRGRPVEPRCVIHLIRTFSRLGERNCFWVRASSWDLWILRKRAYRVEYGIPRSAAVFLMLILPPFRFSSVSKRQPSLTSSSVCPAFRCRGDCVIPMSYSSLDQARLKARQCMSTDFAELEFEVFCHALTMRFNYSCTPSRLSMLNTFAYIRATCKIPQIFPGWKGPICATFTPISGIHHSGWSLSINCCCRIS